jgi:hypothetical protein
MDAIVGREYAVAAELMRRRANGEAGHCRWVSSSLRN